MLIYLFEQVPGGSLLSVMEFGFLGMDSLTSQNQFLLGLGINSDNHNSLLCMVRPTQCCGVADVMHVRCGV